ncbi:MAG: UdgX family uracil-DNA binding protein [Dongiaceae bacterium]
MPQGMPQAKGEALSALQLEAEKCRRCDIWKCGGPVVFGEGPPTAKIMIVGEQPGDQEDRLGHPFVGPAGHILDAALLEASLVRRKLYVSNAVKHFKFTLRGKRRLHQRPTAGEIDICKWWLWQEIEIIKPKLVLALGASAIRSLVGKTLPIERNRGRVIELRPQISLLVSFHPSFILRQRDNASRHELQAKLVEDLEAASRFISSC